MKRFKLLEGRHVGPPPASAKGTPGLPSEVVYVPGDIIESEVDLCERFNPKNPHMPRKFEPYHGPEPAAGTPPVASAPPPPKRAPMPNLDATPVKDLISFAEDNEIDLKGLTRKDDVVRVIRAAYGA